MRRLWLHAVAVGVALCGAAAAAQQHVLVVQDDTNDPCRRFKMRVLVPADRADDKLRAKKTAESIDRGMAWNPCAQQELQLTLAPPPALPDSGGGFLALPHFGLRPAPAESGRGKPAELLRPAPPSAFELMRRRRRP